MAKGQRQYSKLITRNRRLAFSDNARVVRKAGALVNDLRQTLDDRIRKLPKGKFERIHAEAIRREVNRLNTRFEAQAKGLITKGFEDSLSKASTRLKAEGEFLGMPDVQISEKMVKFLGQKNIPELITNLSQTQKAEVMQTLNLGILQGKSTFEVAVDLQDVIKNRSLARIETIARTEIARGVGAVQFGAYEEWEQELPGLKKQWLATKDAYVRKGHLELHGVSLPIDEKFEDRRYDHNDEFTGEIALLDYPSDPAGPGWAVINCRCALASDTSDVSIEQEVEIVRAYLKREG